MTTLKTVQLKCPLCGDHAVDFQAVAIVNADMRPDARRAILDGTFQCQECSACGESFRAEPELHYVDLGRGQWIAAMPAGWVDRWEEIEVATGKAWAQAFGSEAEPAAQDFGGILKPRLVFGWRALAEKLIAWEEGLDDVTVELTKLALMRGLDDEPLAVGQQLRLTDVDAETSELVMLILERDSSELVSEELAVPREVYKGICDVPGDWQKLRSQLSAGYFVDVGRLTRGHD